MPRIWALLVLLAGWQLSVSGQVPAVAIHDSELTRALETRTATPPTPTGSGTTGFEWWPKDWHYFVMPESLKEAMKSDGTPYAVVGDSNITAGVLLTNGSPKYPILISLASEAIRNDEIGPLTNYVAAGGFLIVGSSAFTRNTNGTTRGDFAFANELGLHMVVGGLSNWTNNSDLTKTNDLTHRLTAHIPNGDLTWRMPSSSEEIPWGISPSHPFLAPHDIWKVQAGGATVLAVGDNYPLITVKPYGKGYFIYLAHFQPLIGHSGFAPSMYAYVIFRRAIEWAFEAANMPIPRLSVWPYQYDAAFMVRHDLENFTNEIANIELSAAFEKTNGARGDYYFCTGTLRDDAYTAYNTNSLIASLRRAVTNYGATLGPHNGGLKNPNNPTLLRGQYDYWHWGLDEALDVTPSGYSSGKSYALTSLTNSFRDIETWLSGIPLPPRTWVACYFNATREDSYDIQAQAGVKIAGDQKLTPFPHWTLSTVTPNKRYPFSSQPVSDWFVNGLVAQSLEPWHYPGVHNSQTLHQGIDFYYNLGALINFYSHTMSTGLGDAGPLVPDYITYCADTNLHPRMWGTNSVGVYNWSLQRSNVQVTATFATNGAQSITTFSIKNATSVNTAIEVYIPTKVLPCNLSISTNGVLATGAAYRTVGQIIRIKVGASVTNAVVRYYPYSELATIYSEGFDGVSAPSLPAGWTTSASGAASPWVTTTAGDDSAPNASFTADAANIGVNELVSPVINVPAGYSQLSFRNNYEMEAGAGPVAYDGGVLEIKIGGGGFTDLIAAGGSWLSNGYTDVIVTNSSNPLAGRSCWSGSSVGYVTTVAVLPVSAGGQSVQFRWRCGTDDSTGTNGWRVDSVALQFSACLCCGPTNIAPVLPSQLNRTISELVSLTVTNTATDSNSPPNNINYFLANAPAGASIDANGIIDWTPSEAQGPGVFTLTTVATDDGIPPLSSTNTFNVTVNEINTAPVLPSPPDRTIAELTSLIVTNTAVDSDLPANTLTYSFLNAPFGASISSSGVITWTPSEIQGPGFYTFTTRVVDNGSPAYSDTNTFTVSVNEVNVAPILPGQPNLTIAPQTQITVTNTASDPDWPTNSIAYALTVAPSGAVISDSGVITWMPSLAQDHTTNLFRTIATDNGTPVLSATNTFTVVVNSDPVIAVEDTTLAAEGCLPTNNVIDPSEIVTLLFSLHNIGLGDTTNLVATLLATNGIVSPSGPQSYGTLLAGGLGVSQPFTFTATGACGGNITAMLQLQDGPANRGTVAVVFSLGLVSTVLTQNFDSVSAPALPAGWTSSGSNAQPAWVTQTSVRDTLPNSAFSADAANVGVNELVSPAFTLPTGPAQLSFRNYYVLEAGAGTNGYDGGVLEIKIGAGPFADIVTAGGSFVSGGYNCRLDTGYSNPLGGRLAWSGNSGGFITTLVNLPASAAGQVAQLRWRCGTDNGTGTNGWRIDTIAVSGRACCANLAPILASQSNRTIAELTMLTVTNTGSDEGQSLTYALINPPAGASIDSNGIITWTPDESQGPGTGTITTVATDNGSPPMSSTNSFLVTVTEVNSAPVLPPQVDHTILEHSTLTVTNAATDDDLPANTLTYSLLNPPLGATIDAAGVITWQPSEAQPPGAYPLTTVVNDNGMPALSATNSFLVEITELNSAPVLPAQPDRTTAELVTLTVANTAIDTDLPPNALSYSLVNPPVGASINGTGIITWTPSESQGPSTNILVTIVTDNGSPPLSATNIFTVVVTEVNSAPVLASQVDHTIAELATLTVTNAATDNDLPVNTLSYSLLNAPAGATINTVGIITWTPTEAQGPGTNLIITIVSDNGTPTMSATNTFTVVVTEVNSAPVLPAQTDRTVAELTPLTITNSATDSDLPANTLTYVLINPPAGAVINSAGVITWTPTEIEGTSTNVITTVVTDNGTPALSATNSFTVVVNEVNSAPVLPVQADRTMAELTTLRVTNSATDADLFVNTLSYKLENPPEGATIDGAGVITWIPSEASGPSTNLIITIVADNGTPPLSATNSFAVVVTEVNSAPELPMQTNRTIAELTALVVTNSATDSDWPTNTLSYTLIDAPAGASIDARGVIYWTPGELQGPGINIIQTVATDDGIPPRSTTNSFVVVVTEVNSAPTLPPGKDRTIDGSELLVVTNTAADSDWPANLLTYSLAAAPAGAQISDEGVITWDSRTNSIEGPNLFTTVVTDDGIPVLGATNSFVVTVIRVVPAPIIVRITVTNDVVTLTWTSVAGHTYIIQHVDSITDTNWIGEALGILATGTTMSATNSIHGIDQRFYRVRLSP